MDEAELRFITHHLWEFLSPKGAERERYSYSGSDIALIHRIGERMTREGLDINEVRQQLREEFSSTTSITSRRADLLSFCSGRSGVGITTVIFNLADALARCGTRCTIFDGTMNTRTDSVKLTGERDDDDVWCHVLDSGVRFLRGHQLFTALDGCSKETEDYIYQELKLLDKASDFILIDSCDGGSNSALRYAMLADETVMVMTPDVGMNADCFSVIRMLRDVDPDLPISVVVNRALSLGEAREAFGRITGAGKKLGLTDVPGLGWIIEDHSVHECMVRGEAVVSALPTAPAARCINLLADTIVNRLAPVAAHPRGGLVELVRGLVPKFRKTILAREP